MHLLLTVHNLSLTHSLTPLPPFLTHSHHPSHTHTHSHSPTPTHTLPLPSLTHSHPPIPIPHTLTPSHSHPSHTSTAYPQLSSIEATNISLPLNRSRTVGLLCSGSTLSGYDPPLIEWSDDENNMLTSADDLIMSSGTRGLGYLSMSSSGVMANQSVFTYTCQGSNSASAAGTISTSTTVEYIGECWGAERVGGDICTGPVSIYCPICLR